MARIDKSKIRYIANGEPHNSVVYNRPISDLVDEVDKVLDDVEAEQDAAFITFDGGMYGFVADTVQGALWELQIDKVNGSINLTAGAGLTGGGNLSNNRTFNLGTPSTLNGSTSNGTTSTSHSHEILNTSSRFEPSAQFLLNAKAMHDHVESGDHDGRYVQVGGSGASITGLDASNIDFGTLNPARLSGTYSISINGNAATVTNGVYTSRLISTGSGLTGGGDLSANRTLAVDNTVVRTTGNQTISGIKTLTSDLVINGANNNHVWFRDMSGNNRGLVYYNSVEDDTRIRSYAPNGISVSCEIALTRDGRVNIIGTLNGDGSGLTNLPLGTLDVAGAVRLDNSLTSTAIDRAATANTVRALNNNKADKTVEIATGSGLTGGGNLTANRTLSVDNTVLRTTGTQDGTFTIRTTGSFRSYVSGSDTSQLNPASSATKASIVRARTEGGYVSAYSESMPSAYFGRGVTSGNVVEFFYDGNLRGNISISNTGVSYNTSSDERLKTDISKSDSASEIIDSLDVVQFTWKEGNDHQRYGFIAQQVNETFPEMVNTDNEGMMFVDQTKLIPLLLKEIQELRLRVNALENKGE